MFAVPENSRIGFNICLNTLIGHRPQQENHMAPPGLPGLSQGSFCPSGSVPRSAAEPQPTPNLETTL
jgi:hypothetical protein